MQTDVTGCGGQVARSRGAEEPSAMVRCKMTADYPTPAFRPENSRLDSGLIGRAHDMRLPEWRISLRSAVSRLVSDT